MKNFPVGFYAVTALCLCAVFCSCSVFCQASESVSGCQSLKIMSWNLQTFFDSVYDGNEYAEFSPKYSRWSEEKYNVRLERLSSVIRSVDADIVVMQELENEGQLYDISNRLSGTFDFSRRYYYGCFSKKDGTAIGCGVISRFPLEDVKSHSLDIRTEDSVQPSMRPILQFSVVCGARKLVVFANHWKSKSGGAESSAVWRKYQEDCLAGLIYDYESCGNPVVACGDFNMDITEFSESSISAVSAVPAGSGGYFRLGTDDNAVNVCSPWIRADGTYIEPGSYCYRNEWSRIDHFFSAGTAFISYFNVESEGDWVSDEGYPLRYFLKNGTGYSDHFPISCRVDF